MEVSGGLWAYIWVSAIFGIVNAIIGTILRILTLPLIVLTLGLFAILVNALMLQITDALTESSHDRRVLVDRDLGGDHPRDRLGDPGHGLADDAGVEDKASRSAASIGVSVNHPDRTMLPTAGPEDCEATFSREDERWPQAQRRALRSATRSCRSSSG